MNRKKNLENNETFANSMTRIQSSSYGLVKTPPKDNNSKNSYNTDNNSKTMKKFRYRNIGNDELNKTKAWNLLTSRLMDKKMLEEIEREFPPDQAENLTRKLLNAIRTRDSGKFSRSVRRTHADL